MHAVAGITWAMRWAVHREVPADSAQRTQEAFGRREPGGGLVAATRVGGLTAAIPGLMAAERDLTAATCDLTAVTRGLMAATRSGSVVVPPP